MTTHDRDDPVDARLRAAYRSASTEEPSPHLDDAIRAAARRAAHSLPESIETAQRRRASRTWWPLAAAATIGAIAIGIVDLAPRDERIAPPPVPNASISASKQVSPPAGTSASEPPAPSPAAAPSPPAPPATSNTARAERRASASVAAPKLRRDATPAPAQEPAAAETPVREAPVQALAPHAPPQAFPEREPANLAAAPAPAPAPSAATRDAQSARALDSMQTNNLAGAPAAKARMQAAPAALAPPTFESQVKVIENLVQARRYDEAQRELARLIAAHPDRVRDLPPALKAMLPASTPARSR